MIGWLKLKPRESIGAMADHSTVIWMAGEPLIRLMPSELIRREATGKVWIGLFGRCLSYCFTMPSGRPDGGLLLAR